MSIRLIPYQRLEIWKDIEGYKGLYRVSNLGRVKKYYKNGKTLILKEGTDTRGYKRVFLYKNNVGRAYNIHRLVAMAFIPNPENKPCVDHINTNKSDNTVNNLRWATYKENSNNAMTKIHISESKKGTQNGINNPFYGKQHSIETKRKLGQQRLGGMVYCEELDKTFCTIAEAYDYCITKAIKVNRNHISSCLNGKHKSCGTYKGLKLHWILIKE